jgi:hypothetical protein
MISQRTLLVTLGLVVLPLMTGCGSDSAAVFSKEISVGASTLRGSTQREITVKCQPPGKKPYLVIVYPDVRSDDDKELLKALNDKAVELGPAGAPMLPTLPGLKGTVVVWQKGSLVRYHSGFRATARTKTVLFTVKDDGGPTSVTLKKDGLDVFITDVQ